MLLHRKCVYLLLLLIWANSSQAQPETTTDSIAEYFAVLTGIGEFNGVVKMRKGQTVEVLESFNAVSTPDWARVNVESQFHIASVRKLFNHYLVYQVASEKYASTKLTTFMDSDALYPEWTPQMLLEHRSGLPRGENFDFDQTRYSKTELLALIGKQKLLFAPGSDYLYSNFGHLLLDLANADWFNLPIEKVSTVKIFNPLGMQNTVEINRTSKPVNLNGMWMKDGQPHQVDLAYYQRFPSGDVLSTVQDLDTFLRSMEAELFADNDGIIEHAGAKRGYRSYVYYDTKTDVSFIMLSNHGDMPIAQTIEDVKQLLSGNTVAQPKRIERSLGKFQPNIANAITGHYKLLINQQEMTIKCNNQTLFIVGKDGQGNLTNDPLHFESERTLFFTKDSPDSLLIKGNAPPYELSITGYGNMEFELSKLSPGEGCTTHDE